MTSPKRLEDLSFERDGLVVLRSAFDATGMVDELWGVLGRRFRIGRHDPTTWPAGTFGKLTKWGKTGAAGRFSAVATPVVEAAISSLLETTEHRSDAWGQPLITFPSPGPWTVPRDWHVDARATGALSAIRLFAYCGPVPVQAGGTPVITGSHRLALQRPGLSSAELQHWLGQRSEWFHDLFARHHDPTDSTRFMDCGSVVDGVDVCVVELTGQPGDVVLWHPNLLHTIAQNCASDPRFMLTTTAFRAPLPS